MSIRKLTGLTLDGCRFSKSSYSLDFSGKVGDESKKFTVSTSYYMASTSEEKKMRAKWSLPIYGHLWSRRLSKLERIEKALR